MTDERAIRTALTVGPILACVGIAWVAMSAKDSTAATFGSSAVLIGVATAVWGTHKYGRLGADAPPSSPPPSSSDADEDVDGNKEDRSPSTPA